MEEQRFFIYVRSVCQVLGISTIYDTIVDVRVKQTSMTAMIGSDYDIKG